MKKKAAVALVLALLLLFSACGTISVPPSEGGYYAFRDDERRTVYVDESPARVAVLFSSLADMWCLAGGEVAVTVGESVSRGLVKEDTPLVDAGAGKKIAIESLLAQSPDFVIGSADIPAHKELVPILEKAGIPIALFRVDTFDDYQRVMEILCAITKRSDLYSLSTKVAVLSFFAAAICVAHFAKITKYHAQNGEKR